MTYKKISLNVSPEVYEELQRLCDAGKFPSVSEFIRRGIALQRFMVEAQERGEKLVVADRNGETIREVVLLYG